MRVTAVETLRPKSHPTILWVRIHTDDGLIGTGETLAHPTVVEHAVHSVAGPLLIGQDPLTIELQWHRIFRALNYHGTGGAELRALSAIDIALWDLLGKATDQPIYTLLGGACRSRIPVYNTCGCHAAINDRDRFLSDPGGLAKELVSEGLHMMKIWPFDEFAAETHGQYISAGALHKAIGRVAQIREAVGENIEIAIEGHSLWNLPSAIRIAKELEPFRPIWLEDLIWAEDVAALRDLRAATTIPVIASERLMTRWRFAELIQQGGADIVMFDPVWTGGLSESRKIATLASTRQLPIAPHNCGGPLTHVAVTHLCAHVYNLIAMETIRAFYRSFFADLVTYVPIPDDGHIPLPRGPGLGSDIREDLLASGDLERTVTRESLLAISGYDAGDPWATAQY